MEQGRQDLPTWGRIYAHLLQETPLGRELGSIPGLLPGFSRRSGPAKLSL